ncbi:restriction endonuclease [Ruegeria atlantica]|uniref:restriction endonuclease n=1 Tax=Ruegeria atlantica TaxID=81569 RepID=UPI00147E0B1B|nr:restriction endonuclease [Ruegeria atlantica]
MLDAVEFEKRIGRIYSLLNRDAAVTWNKTIPDPDYPDQNRQIDIEVERPDGLVVHIECRHRSRPQDVQWIEALIGRRESLKADAIVGVSSSGFTKPALAKAKRFGVFLRNLNDISDREVQGWGRRTKLSLHFARIIETALAFIVPRSMEGSIDPVDILNALDERGILDDLVRGHVLKAYARKNLDTPHLLEAKATIDANDKVLAELGLHELLVLSRLKVEYFSKKAEAVGFFEFTEPSQSQSEALVEDFSPHGTEVTSSGDCFATHLDLSKIECPDGCVHIPDFIFDMSAPMRMDNVTISGPSGPTITKLQNISVRLGFKANDNT